MATFPKGLQNVATYGYMDGEHAFSAAIVLTMVCVAFPYNAEDTAAMDAALELLQLMAHLGNRHIEARYQLLAHLRSTISPPAAAPAASAPATVLHVDNATLGEMFYESNPGDFGLWEEGYTNTDLGVEYHLTQWTQAAEYTWSNTTA